jgi:sugar/nucleoside kinase (ribokinase family)
VNTVSATSFHFGPLVRHDISLQLLKRVAGRAQIISLDVQGMVRPARLGVVAHEDWADKEAWLEFVDILKADDEEAFIVSGETDVRKAASVLASLGPKEIVITKGSRGSLIAAGGVLHEIPSSHPGRVVDPTGCGDTYMAGYLFKRLRGAPPEIAGRFGAAIATLKLETPGPFSGGEKAVDALLS